jgi:hypothetical protein
MVQYSESVCPGLVERDGLKYILYLTSHLSLTYARSASAVSKEPPATMTDPATPKSFHALVFGGSGITGWAIAKEALTFDHVIALTNSPLRNAKIHCSLMMLDFRSTVALI